MNIPEAIDVFSTFITAITTVGLVIIAFRQNGIQKTQTQIQSKSLKISMLEQRLDCLYNINSTRADFLTPPNLSNIIGFYNTGSNAYTIQEFIQHADKKLVNFSKAVENSKYLFSEKHYNYLQDIRSNLLTFNVYNKQFLFIFNSLIQDTNNPNYFNICKELEKIITNIGKGTFDEKKLFELCLIDYDNYNSIREGIIQKFSNEEFFSSFGKYLILE